MANVTATARATSSAALTPADTTAAPQPIPIGPTTCAVSYANGTAADQVNLVHHKTYSLAAAATALNLYDGSLLDAQGNACAFRKVRRLRIKHLGTTDGHTLAVGYAALTSNAWTAPVTNPGQLTIYPSSSTNDGWWELTAPTTSGMTVSNTSKLLNLDPGANTFDVLVEIDGTDA